MAFGWCFFKKGLATNGGKNHFIPEEIISQLTWKSLCGHWTILPHERKYIHFTEKSNLRKRKICTTCERFLKRRADVVEVTSHA